MPCTVYHGTTNEKLAAIKRRGLRKGSFVSPDKATAEWFARARAQWNGHDAVVLSFAVPKHHIGRLRLDRHGRLEAQTTAILKHE